MAEQRKTGLVTNYKHSKTGKVYKYGFITSEGIVFADDDKSRLIKRVDQHQKERASKKAREKRAREEEKLMQKKPAQPIQKKTQTPTEIQAERNQRRNNYIEKGRLYGFEGRDAVRQLQRFLLSKFGNEYQFLKNYAPGATGIDGYFGNSTEAAYIDAWQKHPEEMAAQKYKRPETHGPGMVKIGNKEYPATDQNIRNAAKVKAADNHVAKEYSDSKMFNMFTMGAPNMLSLSNWVGTGAQALSGNYNFADLYGNFTNANNQGLFEITDRGKKWAQDHQLAANIINAGADVIIPTDAIKFGPKVGNVGKAILENGKNRLLTNLENISKRVVATPYEVMPKGYQRMIKRQLAAWESGGEGKFHQLVGEKPMANGLYKETGMVGVPESAFVEGVSTKGAKNIGMVDVAHQYSEPKDVIMIPLSYAAKKAPWGPTVILPPAIRQLPQEVTSFRLRTPENVFTLDGQAPTYVPKWQIKPDINDLHSAENK